ncbi:MAG: hypothetical protein JWL73_1938 [Actinomycetia bacterium]|nr:hypothetical protein [Actinomycetes bacterium]
MRVDVTGVAWSHVGGEDCIRLVGVAPGADVRVRVPPAHMVGELPPMAGRLIADGDDRCFVPRFPFIPGTAYAVVVDGETVAELARPRVERPATAEVLEIHPAVSEVPRNLLRIYVTFSGPMREGVAAAHVRLVDAAGVAMHDALLPMEPELWDGSRQRLTVLLDPARIKRGLVGHQELGYPLRAGERFRVVVDGAWLRVPHEREYAVIDDERRRIEPERWIVRAPAASTREPVEIVFDRPLDHALLARCLRVVGVDGVGRAGPEDRSWTFVPIDPWPAGAHSIAVDPVLEDLAGNSVDRVFDRDLADAADTPRTPGPVHLPFTTR